MDVGSLPLRVALGCQQADFRIAPCPEAKAVKPAIARDINQRFVTDSGEKKSLPQKTELLKAYIDAVYSDDQISTEEQKAAISRKLVGEYWKGLFE